MGVGCQLHAPAALSPGMTRYPLYRRLYRSQDGNSRPQPNSILGLSSKWLSPYTDYATPASIEGSDATENTRRPRSVSLYQMKKKISRLI
jgi:hypothetical protein